MLRFIFLTWLTSPANQEKHRDSINLLVCQRDEWVHYISESAILKIYTGDFFCSKVISCSQGNCKPFIWCDDVLILRSVVSNKTTEILEQWVRYSGEEVNLMILQDLVKFRGFEEISLKFKIRRFLRSPRTEFVLK